MWTSGCRSQVSSRGYARYYSFDLARESDVTIDLMSSVDTYLYLRSGNTRSGTGLHENDDVEPEVDTDSRISQTLAAGAYTIEATTYNTGTAGTFTLTLVGLGGTSPGEGEQLPVSDPCSRTVHSDGTFPGTWAAGYQSQVTGRGYARFFTFTLARESEVTIDLEFGVDPYLYLRGGPVRTGAALAYNDDVEPTVDTDSQIVETLAAGTYTIEATTYYPATAGALTLIIRGLASVSAGNPGTEPQDTCDDTLDGDGVTAGTWSSGCRSSVAQRGYARYYSLTLALESEVTIDLESSVDPYLLLREGVARCGDFLYENDDMEPGVNLDSRISERLPAGTYTIEATTYYVAQSGGFTLMVAGLG